MGRDGYGRGGWGQSSYYNDRYRDRDYGYGGRRYERDDRRYDDRYGNYRHGDRRDRYGRDGGGYRDRYHGGGGFRGRGGRRGGGFRGGRDQKRNFQDKDEIDPEELEYIRKRQEVLKQRRDEEENYVPEDVDAEALAAMGLPMGFGPPPKTDDENGDQDNQDDANGRDREQSRHEEKTRDNDHSQRDGRRRSRERSEEREEKRIKLDDEAEKSQDHEQAGDDGTDGEKCVQKDEVSTESLSNPQVTSEAEGQSLTNEPEQTADDESGNKNNETDQQQGSLVTYSAEESNSE